MMKYKSNQLDFDLSQFFKELDSDINQYYTIGDVIGKGAFAEVKQIWHKETGQERAMKVFNIKNMSPEMQEEIFNEATTLKKLSHPNILKYYECFRHNDFHYIVFEMCRGGELFDEIAEKNGGTGIDEYDASIIIK